MLYQSSDVSSWQSEASAQLPDSLCLHSEAEQTRAWVQIEVSLSLAFLPEASVLLPSPSPSPMNTSVWIVTPCLLLQDKRFASGKYQDVYMELNHIKVRSEREIEQLKEHLRLAMAALQEKETLCNSIAE